MSLYPSLEDMKVDNILKMQTQILSKTIPPIPSAPHPEVNHVVPSMSNSMYPSLGDYMGLELTQEMIQYNMPEYLVPAAGGTSQFIAPISGQSLGLHRAQVTNGIRQLVICKDKDNKIGLRVKTINNGVFVCLVIDKSPAALAGIRFGDQILQINGQDMAGFSMNKVHEIFKKCPVNGIEVIIRDRPFERTITLHKDIVKSLGFQFKNGKIVTIVKDSSASRNGVLTEHQLLEVEGQNVVGLKDKKISQIIDEAGDVVTVTVIPSFIYEHMIKKMSSSLLRDLMDHTIPSF